MYSILQTKLVNRYPHTEYWYKIVLIVLLIIHNNILTFSFIFSIFFFIFFLFVYPDREAGILLDSPMEESEALGDPSPNNSYSRVDNISTSNDSISVYRTRGHIRSLNMQTPT